MADGKPIETNRYTIDITPPTGVTTSAEKPFQVVSEYDSTTRTSYLYAGTQAKSARHTVEYPSIDAPANDVIVVVNGGKQIGQLTVGEYRKALFESAKANYDGVFLAEYMTELLNHSKPPNFTQFVESRLAEHRRRAELPGTPDGRQKLYFPEEIVDPRGRAIRDTAVPLFQESGDQTTLPFAAKSGKGSTPER